MAHQQTSPASDDSAHDDESAEPSSHRTVRWERRRVKGARRGRTRDRAMMTFFVVMVLGALFLLAWSTNWGTTIPFKPVGT